MNCESSDRFSDIVIAVHGIGDQMRNETVRATATRFARIGCLASNEVLVAPQPLGYFHTDVHDYLKALPVDRAFASKCRLADIGFTEVYWADLPQAAVKDQHTLEETKGWARTVVSRVRAEHLRSNQKGVAKPDFSLVAEVLDEIIDTVGVLENLTFLASKAGIFEFKLREVLEQFVGDVQLFTEFKSYRHQIIGRFQTALHKIHEENSKARLHIVAHSEGTVVSLLGLMLAMAGEYWDYSDTQKGVTLSKQNTPLPWVKNVRGLMTIGSPLDKHLLLWPELFDGFGCSDLPRAEGQPPIEWDLSEAKKTLPPDLIHWRNYYDYGDPVGFELNSMREWLKSMAFKVFDFTEDHDHGFARYPLPGKAHVDYWQDAQVFEHFECDVIQRVQHEASGASGKPADAPALKSRPLVPIVSWTLPYALSFGLLYAGVALLHRSVEVFKHPAPDAMQVYYLSAFRQAAGAVGPQSFRGPEDTKLVLLESVWIATLIAGTTLLARWPRLMRGAWSWLAGFTSFAVGATLYSCCEPIGMRQELGSLAAKLNGFMGWLPDSGRGETIFVVAMALGVALVSLVLTGWPTTEVVKLEAVHNETLGRSLRHQFKLKISAKTRRRERWWWKKLRPLMVAGVLLVAAIVWCQLTQSVVVLAEQQLNELTALATAKHLALPPYMYTSKPSIIPVLLSGAAFLYLWWLATLIFDLAFTWHRYVRWSRANEAIREVVKGRRFAKQLQSNL
jgi:hypothetical protein